MRLRRHRTLTGRLGHRADLGKQPASTGHPVSPATPQYPGWTRSDTRREDDASCCARVHADLIARTVGSSGEAEPWVSRGVIRRKNWLDCYADTA
ncbi:hypothetical protein Vwe01_16110 [Micromonospora andamanensis]|nr:hypothetical protein Vwe01_16110 [Micromonospora andamanensis]